MSAAAPARAERDARYNRSEKGKARQARYREAHRAKRRESQLRYWHRADGGWIKRRKRDLQGQREAVMSRLEELRREDIAAGWESG